MAYTVGSPVVAVCVKVVCVSEKVVLCAVSLATIVVFPASSVVVVVIVPDVVMGIVVDSVEEELE